MKKMADYRNALNGCSQEGNFLMRIIEKLKVELNVNRITKIWFEF